MELLQFHWYDVSLAMAAKYDQLKADVLIGQYTSKEYLDILTELVKATKTHPELVSAIGLCNFDAEHTEEACKYVLEKTGGVGIVSNQVQVWCCLS